MVGVTLERMLNSFVILMRSFYAFLLHGFHPPVCALCHDAPLLLTWKDKLFIGDLLCRTHVILPTNSPLRSYLEHIPREIIYCLEKDNGGTLCHCFWPQRKALVWMGYLLSAVFHVPLWGCVLLRMKRWVGCALCSKPVRCSDRNIHKSCTSKTKWAQRSRE